MADEEAQELRSFQAAIAAQSTMLHELKETTPAPAAQEKASVRVKNPVARPLGMIIKVKPQTKKARIEPGSPEKDCNVVEAREANIEESLELAKTPNRVSDALQEGGRIGLVSYSDESEDED